MYDCNRKEILLKSGLCFKWLRPCHTSRNCSNPRKCFYCKEGHNSVLCHNQVKGTESANLFVKSDMSVLLQTAVVNISNPNNLKTVVTRMERDCNFN